MSKFEKYTLPYIVVYIPSYNEEKTLGKVIKDIQDLYQGEKTRDYIVDIIVVNDGSKDKTAEVAEKAGVKRIVTHPRNRGLGAATRTGMQTAYEMGADIAVKIDADGQNPASEIEKVVRPILEDRADCVFGSRLMGGLKYKMPFYRDVGNKFFAWLISQIIRMPWTDATTGLIATNRRYLRVFTIVGDYNETQQLIIDSWGKNMRIIEVSTIFLKRGGGKSFIKAGIKYPSNVLPAMLRTYLQFRALRFFFTSGLIVTIFGIILAILIILNNGQAIGILGDSSVAILILAGLQIMFFGLLADIIAKKRS